MVLTSPVDPAARSEAPGQQTSGQSTPHGSPSRSQCPPRGRGRRRVSSLTRGAPAPWQTTVVPQLQWRGSHPLRCKPPREHARPSLVHTQCRLACWGPHPEIRAPQSTPWNPCPKDHATEPAPWVAHPGVRALEPATMLAPPLPSPSHAKLARARKVCGPRHRRSRRHSAPRRGRARDGSAPASRRGRQPSSTTGRTATTPVRALPNSADWGACELGCSDHAPANDFLPRLEPLSRWAASKEDNMWQIHNCTMGQRRNISGGPTISYILTCQHVQFLSNNNTRAPGEGGSEQAGSKRKRRKHD